MRMQVILDSLDSSFARPGSAPVWDGKKGEFRDWTTSGAAKVHLCRNCADKNETVKKEETRNNKRALFVACDDSLRPPTLYTMTFVDEEAF